MSGTPRDRKSEQALLVRILAIPFVPIVALWELLKALVRGLETGLRWLGVGLSFVARLPFRAIATLFRWLVAFLEAAGRVLLPIIGAVGRGLRWLALLFAEAILPVLIRAGLIVRELIRELVIAVRALGVRIMIPLRLLARGAVALMRRAGLILRFAARSIWLALAALWARILVPLRLAFTALALLTVRLVLLISAAVRGLGSAADFMGHAIWRWLLAPIGRALAAAARAVSWAFNRAAAGLFLVLRWIGRLVLVWVVLPVGRVLSAVFRAARWLVGGLADLFIDLVLLPIGRGLSALFRAARWLIQTLAREFASALRWVGRFLLTWLVRPVHSGVAAILRAALWVVRRVGSALRAAALVALLQLIPVGRAAWKMAAVVAATVSAAARLAWRPISAVLSTIGAAADAAIGTVRGAVSRAAAAVVAAVHGARVAVAEAVHDSRNLIRRALGRPALSAFVWREPPPKPVPVKRREPPANRQQRRSTVGGIDGRLVFAGALGIVLTLVVVGFMTGKPSSAPNPHPQSQTSTRESAAVPTPITPAVDTERCPLLQPGGPLSATPDMGCGTLANAAPVAVLDCTTATGLPPSLVLEGYDGSVLTQSFFSGAPDPGIAYVNRSCRLAVQANQVASLATEQTGVGDVVVIADFVPPGHTSFDVGVDARCTPGPQCVHALVTESGQTLIGEHVKSGAWQHEAGPQLEAGTTASRIVMWLHAGQAMAWLNGRVIGPLAVSSESQPGRAGFFFLNQDEVPLQVDLRQLAILSLTS